MNDGGLLVDVESYLYWHTSAGPHGSETHGGDDVLIFANGPASHLFHQTHEQTHIPNVMAYAACVGQYNNIDPEDPLCEASKLTTYT